jgi:PPOX class probable F420-dependent enzyme
MTDFPASHRDLLDAQVATLATIGDDGLPQLTEIWFIYDDGELKTSLSSGRVKTANLRKRPACSLLILDLANPYRYLEVRGTAKLDDAGGAELAQKVGAKYDADLAQYDGPGETRIAVTIAPTKVHPVDMSG